MKRFLKIFLIVFASLVGVVGAIIGIMFATGYFAEDKIEPSEIHFEYDEYNKGENFSLTVLSNDLGGEQDISQKMKTVTLSFKNATTNEVNGMISNGVIKVPKIVTLGEPFTVTVVQEINDEVSAKEGMDTYWNVGGQSILVATSASQKVKQAETKINIDVPVYSLELKTGNSLDDISNGIYNSKFNVGADFVAQARFIPAESQYLYGKADISKTVLIDLRKQSDSAYTTAGKEAETYRVFTAKDATASVNGVEIVAKTFKTGEANTIALNAVSSLEDAQKRAELLVRLSDTSVGLEASAFVTHSIQQVTSFEVGNTAGEFTFNQNTRVYANTSSNSFGIKIYSNELTLNYKVRDIGIVAKVVNNDGGLESPEEGVIVINGGGQFETSQNSGIFAITPNYIAENTGGSYWDIAIQEENLIVVFEFYIKDNGDLEDDVKGTYKTSPRWTTTSKVASKITWKDEADVSLKFVDGDTVIADEYDLGANININSDASYNVIKYIAYTTDGVTFAKDLIGNSVASSKFNFSSDETLLYNTLGDNIDRACEIDGEVLRTGANTGTLYIVAVVIKTNYNGAPIYESGHYVIDSIVVLNQGESSSVQPLKITIEKTLKSLNIKDRNEKYTDAENYDAGEYKSPIKADGTQDIVSYPAFKAGNSFDITLEITAGEENIFKKAWEDGDVRFDVYDLESNQISQVIIYNRDLTWSNDNSKTEFVVNFTASSTITKDSSYKIVLTYVKKGEIEQTITVLDKVEIYDGKAYGFDFIYDIDEVLQTTEANRLKVSTSVTTDGTTVTDITSQYEFEGNAITNVVENNQYRTKAYDKYNNVITGESASQIGGKQGETNDGYYLTYSIEDCSSALVDKPLSKKIFIETGDSEFELKNVQFYEETTASNIVAEKSLTIASNKSSSGQINLTGNSYTNSLIIYNLVKKNNTTLSGYEEEKDLNGDYNGNIIYYRVLPKLVSFEIVYDNELGNSFFTISNDNNADVKNIEFKNGAGREYEININSLVVGFDNSNVKMKVTVEPYYSMTYQNSTDLGTTADSSGLSRVNVYSGSNDIIVLKFDNSVSKGDFKIYKDGTVNTDYTLSVLDSNFVATNELSGEILGLLPTGNYPLGETTIEIKHEATKASSYGFSRALMLYGIPDVKVSVNENYEYTQEENTYTLVEPIYWDETNVVVVYAESGGIFQFTKSSDDSALNYDTTPSIILADNGIDNSNFSLVDGKLTRTGLISGSQKLKVSLAYKFGDKQEVILNLVLTIMPDMLEKGVDENIKLVSSLYDEELGEYAQQGEGRQAFGYYEGVGLMLTAGKTYTYEDILKVYKTNSGNDLTSSDYEISFVETSATEILYSVIDNNAITVKDNLITVSYGSYLTIKQKSGENIVSQQTFKVIFLPMEFSVISDGYSEKGSYEGTLAELNSDIRVLYNPELLKQYGIYNALTGGTQTLFSGIGLNAFAGGTSGYTLEIENEDGSPDSYRYIESFDQTNGIIKTRTVGEETFVYIVISQSGIKLFKYRLCIMPNSSLNVYYPYIIGANPTEKLGEYVDTSKGSVTIDFSEELSIGMPNWEETKVITETPREVEHIANRKRIVLQTNNDNKIINADYEYSILKVVMGSHTYTSVNEINAFATMSDSILTINEVNSYFVVYINAIAKISGNKIGETAEYQIHVNSSADENYVLQVTAGGEAWDKTEIVVEGDELDLKTDASFRVVLVEENSGMTNVVENELGLHVFDETKKTEICNDLIISNADMTIKLNKNIVSDYTATLVLYTRYGAMETLPITFKSSISNEISIDKNTADEYYVYGGETVNFEEKITIKSDTDTLTPASMKVLVDEVEVSTNYTFPKTSEDKTVQVVVECDLGEGYEENYIFTFELKVFASVKSNFTSQSSPFISQDDYIAGTDVVNTLFETWALRGETITLTTNALFTFTSAPAAGDFSFEIIYGESAIDGDVSGISVTDNQITVQTKSVAERTPVLIQVKYKLDNDVYYSAYLYFVVISNFNLSINYYEGLSAEHLFVPEGGATINFDSPQIFVTEKRVTSSNEASVITIRYDGANYSNAVEVSADKTATNELYPKDTNFTITWGTNATYSQATLTFSIFVDGNLAGEYTVIVYKQATEIFASEIDSFETVFEGGVETYTVPSPASSFTNIFSNAYQKFTFTVKNDELLNSLGENEYFEFVVNEGYYISGQTKLTKDDIGSQKTIYIYGANQALSEDNLNIFVSINKGETIVGDFAETLKGLYTVGSLEFSHKLSVYYKGNEVPFDIYKNYIKNDTIALEDFVIDYSQEDKTECIFKLIDGNSDVLTNFFTYAYQTQLDFKVEKTYDYLEARNVGQNITDVLDTFGVTKYNGGLFERKYFEDYKANVKISSNLALVVSKDFSLPEGNDPSSWTMDKFYDNGLKSGVRFVNYGFGGNADYPYGSNNFAYVATQLLSDNSTTYNFQYTLSGAENNGNIAIFTITYEYYPNGTGDETDKRSVTEFVAVSLTADYNVTTKNGTTVTSQNNTQGEPLVISYASSAFNNIVLSAGEGSGNYIYVTNPSLTGGVNIAYEKFKNYEIINSEMRNYVSISITDNNITLSQVSGKVLEYSNLESAIRFYDEAGYEFYYYIKLIGESTEKIEFNSIYDARTGEQTENIYEGSKIAFVDASFLGVLATNYKNKVLELAQQNTYKDVDYFVFISNLDKVSTKVSPTLKIVDGNNYLYDGSLVNKVTKEENSIFDFAVLGGDAFTTSGAIAANLDYFFNVNEANGELVTVNFNILLAQRWLLEIKTNNYLLNDEEYHLSDFLSVKDAKYSNQKLGDVTLVDAYTIKNDSGAEISSLTFTKDGDTKTLNINAITAGGYGHVLFGSKEFTDIKSYLNDGYTCSISGVTISEDKQVTIIMAKRAGKSIDFELVNNSGVLTVNTDLDTDGAKVFYLIDNHSTDITFGNEDGTNKTIANAHSYVFVNGSIDSDEQASLYSLTISGENIQFDNKLKTASDFVTNGKVSTQKSLSFNAEVSANGQTAKFANRSLSYYVTTNPYSYTATGNIVIDHSGFTKNNDGTYTVYFEDWIGGLSSYDYNGSNLGSMYTYTMGKKALTYAINDDTSAGAATLSEDFTIDTTSAFTIGTSSIVINVYSKLSIKDDGSQETILLGSLTIVLVQDRISAPAQGTYTVVQTVINDDGTQARSAQVDFTNSRTILISDITNQYNIFEQDNGGKYSYKLISVLKRVESIALKSSNIVFNLICAPSETARINQELKFKLSLNNAPARDREFILKFDEQGRTATLYHTSTDEENRILGSNDITISQSSVSFKMPTIASGINYGELYGANKIDMVVTNAGSEIAESSSLGLGADLYENQIALYKVTRVRELAEGGKDEVSKTIGYAFSSNNPFVEEGKIPKGTEVDLNVASAFDDNQAGDSFVTTALTYNLVFGENGSDDSHGISGVEVNKYYQLMDTSSSGQVSVYLLKALNTVLDKAFAFTINSDILQSGFVRDGNYIINNQGDKEDYLTSVSVPTAIGNDFKLSCTIDVLTTNEETGETSVTSTQTYEKYLHNGGEAISLTGIGLNTKVATFEKLTIEKEDGFDFTIYTTAGEHAYTVNEGSSSTEYKFFKITKINDTNSVWEYGFYEENMTIGNVVKDNVLQEYYINLSAGVYSISDRTTTVNINNPTNQGISLEDALGSIDTNKTYTVTALGNYNPYTEDIAGIINQLRFSLSNAGAQNFQFNNITVANIHDGTLNKWFVFNAPDFEGESNNTRRITLAVLSDNNQNKITTGPAKQVHNVYYQSTRSNKYIAMKEAGQPLDLAELFGEVNINGEVFKISLGASILENVWPASGNNGYVMDITAPQTGNFSRQNITGFKFVEYKPWTQTIDETTEVYMIEFLSAFAGSYYSLTPTIAVNANTVLTLKTTKDGVTSTSYYYFNTASEIVVNTLLVNGWADYSYALTRNSVTMNVALESVSVNDRWMWQTTSSAGYVQVQSIIEYNYNNNTLKTYKLNNVIPAGATVRAQSIISLTTGFYEIKQGTSVIKVVYIPAGNAQDISLSYSNYTITKKSGLNFDGGISAGRWIVQGTSSAQFIEVTVNGTYYELDKFVSGSARKGVTTLTNLQLNTHYTIKGTTSKEIFTTSTTIDLQSLFGTVDYSKTYTFTKGKSLSGVDIENTEYMSVDVNNANGTYTFTNVGTPRNFMNGVAESDDYYIIADVDEYNNFANGIYKTSYTLNFDTANYTYEISTDGGASYTEFTNTGDNSLTLEDLGIAETADESVIIKVTAKSPIEP